MTRSSTPPRRSVMNAETYLALNATKGLRSSKRRARFTSGDPGKRRSVPTESKVTLKVTLISLAEQSRPAFGGGPSAGGCKPPPGRRGTANEESCSERSKSWPSAAAALTSFRLIIGFLDCSGRKFFPINPFIHKSIHPIHVRRCRGRTYEASVF